jgi:hypothetical protein
MKHLITSLLALSLTACLAGGPGSSTRADELRSCPIDPIIVEEGDNPPQGETCYKTCTNDGYVADPGCPAGQYCRFFNDDGTTRYDSCNTPSCPDPDPRATQPGSGDWGNCTPH